MGRWYRGRKGAEVVVWCVVDADGERAETADKEARRGARAEDKDEAKVSQDAQPLESVWS